MRWKELVEGMGSCAHGTSRIISLLELQHSITRDIAHLPPFSHRLPKVHMRSTSLLAPPLFILTIGCQSTVKDVVVIEYHPYLTPPTTIAKCDATFTLTAPEPTKTLLSIELKEGETIGYRSEPDGSIVAIAGEQTIPIPYDWSIWRYTPKPNNQGKRFLDFASDVCDIARSLPRLIFTSPLWVPCACTGVWP